MGPKLTYDGLTEVWERILQGYALTHLMSDGMGSFVLNEYLKGPMRDMLGALGRYEFERGGLDQLVETEPAPGYDEPEEYDEPKPKLNPGFCVSDPCMVTVHNAQDAARPEPGKVQGGTTWHPRWTPEYNQVLDKANDTVGPDVPRCG